MVSPKSKIQSSKFENNFELPEKLTKDDKQTPKNKLKIVRIIARLNVGGPARHVVWLTKELRGEEFESVLLAGTVPVGEEDMSYFAAENAVAPVLIEEMSRELSMRDAISLWKIFRLLKREQPDIVHTHTAKAGTVGRIAGFFYRWLTWTALLGKPRPVKFVHTFHGHVFHSYYGNLKTKIFLAIEKILARMATDKIVVISRRQFEEIHEQFGVGKREQFQIIPLGIDLESFADWHSKRNTLREEIGAADNDVIVGLVGRLTEVKNHRLYLEIVKIWREKYAGKVGIPELKFVIIGDGHLRETLEKEAAALGIKDAVTFLGNRNDTDVFYAGLDIVALTSLNEGTPLSLIEAMANEKAIISTNVGGVSDLLGEIVEQKEGFQVCERGIAAASNDAEGFCSGLEFLANSAKTREIIGQSGNRFVNKQYGKARLVEDIKNLYRTLTKN